MFEPEVLDYLKDDESILEREALEDLASDSELVAFRHYGFWQPMDTLRRKAAAGNIMAERQRAVGNVGPDRKQIVLTENS